MGLTADWMLQKKSVSEIKDTEIAVIQNEAQRENTRKERNGTAHGTTPTAKNPYQKERKEGRRKHS